SGAKQRTYCLNRFFRRRPMRVVLDVQLTGEDLGEVDLDTGLDGKVQLAVRPDHFQIGRRTHRRNQTVVGDQDDIGQPRGISDVLRAEVQPRLLDNSIGEV